MTDRIKVWASLVLPIFVFPSLTFSQTSHFILAIGDSHGAMETGWVNQLRELRPNDSILNVAISGNTIGFDNLDKESLNELKNIQHQLSRARAFDKDVDYIIVLLGTNDCKAIFDARREEVPKNLERLTEFIMTFNYQQLKPPELILVTPPPIAGDGTLESKYHGAGKRLANLLPHYAIAAKRVDCLLIDIYNSLRANFESISKDGIHLTDDGYRQIAKMINDQIPNKH